LQGLMLFLFRNSDVADLHTFPPFLSHVSRHPSDLLRF
jgi:hypothetical protein